MNGTHEDDHARQERFARALDAGADSDHPEFGRELAVVAALRELGDRTSVPAGSRRRIDRRVAPRRKRRQYLLVAGFCVLAILPALLLARDTLPGDALYGLKRAGEQAQLAFHLDEQARARMHLEFAQRRITELEALSRQPGTAAEPVRRALGDFSSDARAGTATLTPVATNSGGRQLKWLRGWAHAQHARLRTLAAVLPAPSGPAEALLTRIRDRAGTLWQRMPCAQITSGRTDALGVLPAGGSCHDASPRPGPNVLPARKPPAVPPRSPADVLTPDTSVPATPPPRQETLLEDVEEETSAPGTRPRLPVPRVPAPPRVPDPPELTVPLPLELAEIPPLAPGLPRLDLGG